MSTKMKRLKVKTKKKQNKKQSKTDFHILYLGEETRRLLVLVPFVFLTDE